MNLGSLVQFSVFDNIMDFIEQTVALAPADEKGAAREILIGIFHILYGPDFSALAEHPRQSGDTLRMLGDGLYRGVGALIEANGGDMTEMVGEANGGVSKRHSNDVRRHRMPRSPLLHWSYVLSIVCVFPHTTP